jgi:hypothetical protein
MNIFTFTDTAVVPRPPQCPDGLFAFTLDFYIPWRKQTALSWAQDFQHLMSSPTLVEQCSCCHDAGQIWIHRRQCQGHGRQHSPEPAQVSGLLLQVTPPLGSVFSSEPRVSAGLHMTSTHCSLQNADCK